MTFTPCNLSFRQLEVLVDHSEKDRPINVKSSKHHTTLTLIRLGLLRQRTSQKTTITKLGYDKMLKALKAWGDLVVSVDESGFSKLHVEDVKIEEAQSLAGGDGAPLADLVREAVLPQPPEAFAGANQALGEEHRKLRVHDPAAG